MAISGGGVSIAAAIYAFATDFPRGLVVLACVLGALAAAWFGLLRRGGRRLAGSALAALLLGIAIGATVSGGNGTALLVSLAAFPIGIAGARIAFRAEHSLPRAEPPRHPVLFVNPRSGDGRTARVGLVEAARKRGIRTVVLEPGDDLETLVRDAVGEGADALAMAVGDGSRALVAAIAAEHDLPYACILSGTRNHFALDLGVDREDIVGALDALTDGGERYVDLGEVNGRVFFNNVSLGVDAQAVSQERYRAAKLRTLFDTMADTLGPDGEAAELRWRDPDCAEQTSTALVLVSNNPYLLGPTLGSRTRPRLDTGLLGVVDFQPPIGAQNSEAARWRELRTADLEIECDTPLPVGVDGESLTLEAPLRFRVRPGALRVRIARDDPGASPSAELPHGAKADLRALLDLARGG